MWCWLRGDALPRREASGEPRRLNARTVASERRRNVQQNEGAPCGAPRCGSTSVPPRCYCRSPRRSGTKHQLRRPRAPCRSRRRRIESVPPISWRTGFCRNAGSSVASNTRLPSLDCRACAEGEVVLLPLGPPARERLAVRVEHGVLGARAEREPRVQVRLERHEDVRHERLRVRRRRRSPPLFWAKFAPNTSRSSEPTVQLPARPACQPAGASVVVRGRLGCPCTSSPRSSTSTAGMTVQVARRRNARAATSMFVPPLSV